MVESPVPTPAAPPAPAVVHEPAPEPAAFGGGFRSDEPADVPAPAAPPADDWDAGLVEETVVVEEANDWDTATEEPADDPEPITILPGDNDNDFFNEPVSDTEPTLVPTTGEVAEDIATPAEEPVFAEETAGDDLFGDTAAEPADDDLFGAEPAAEEAPADDLFGEPAAADDALFGEEPAATEQSGDLFGEEPAEEVMPAEEGDLFGEEPAEAADDLFGEEPADNAGDLFGEETAEEAGSDDLFGEAPAEESGDLFGEEPAEAAGDLFEEAPAEEAGDLFDAGGEGTDAEDDLFGEFGAILSEPGGVQSTRNRTWIDNTGRFSTVGRLLSIDSTSIRLTKVDGAIATVPLGRLSQADLLFVSRQSLALAELTERAIAKEQAAPLRTAQL